LFKATKGNCNVTKVTFNGALVKLPSKFLSSQTQKQSSKTPRNSKHLRTPKDRDSPARFAQFEVGKRVQYTLILPAEKMRDYFKMLKITVFCWVFIYLFLSKSELNEYFVQNCTDEYNPFD